MVSNQVRENYKKSIPTGKKMMDRSKKMSNEDIYEEFWQFIDDDNVEFQEFILKDKRRKK